MGLTLPGASRLITRRRDRPSTQRSRASSAGSSTQSEPTFTGSVGLFSASAQIIAPLGGSTAASSSALPVCSRTTPDPSALPISSVELTACTTQHNAQVIAKLPFKATDNFKEIRETQAGPDCSEQYRLKVQPTILADSAYQSVILSPRDQDSWNRQPFVACVLVTETPTVGSTFIS